MANRAKSNASEGGSTDLRLRAAACALSAVLALCGCGPGEELAALQLENQKLLAQLEQARDQANEMRASFSEIHSRLEDVRGNLRIGAYARYGRSLAKDLDELAARVERLAATEAAGEPDYR